MNENFFCDLKRASFEAQERTCLEPIDGAPVSYGALDALSARMAGALLETGAKPGDRVLVQVEKSIANVALYLGAMRAGLVYVPLNTAYTGDELSYFLQDAEPAVLICDPSRQETLRLHAKSAGAKEVLTLDADSRGSLADAADCAAPFLDIAKCSADDLAVILYTSGTTGRSKGAMLSHANLASNAKALKTLWAFTTEDRLLHALPIFHIHGLFVALHTAMLSVAQIVFLPRFEIDAVLAALANASVMMGVPTFYTRLLAAPQFTSESAAHMRLFISGSAPLTEETFAAFEARTGQRILERYGMSEAGMIASNPYDGERIAGTVGFALPDVAIRIAGDDGAARKPGETGGVEIKGPNLFKGYWRKPEKTAEEFTADGWFKTGDVGALGQDGRLSLMGRAKDLIIAGGYNIYPKEIEQALDAVPGVAECAVIGAPHPDMGEGVAAVLIGEDGPVDDAILRNALEALARFKHPRRFFWLDALPRNAMGKVQKQILRERFKDAFA